MDRRRFLGGIVATLAANPLLTEVGVQIENQGLKYKYETIANIYSLLKELESAKSINNIYSVSKKLFDFLKKTAHIFVFKINEGEWGIESPQMSANDFVVDFDNPEKNLLYKRVQQISDYVSSIGGGYSNILEIVVNLIFEKIKKTPYEIRGSDMFKDMQKLTREMIDFLEEIDARWNVPTAKALGLRLVEESIAPPRTDTKPDSGSKFRKTLEKLNPSENIEFR